MKVISRPLETIVKDITFYKFRDLVYKETGIFMKETKKVLLSNRLRKRILELGLNSFEEYYDYLILYNRNEMANFINAISTNETYFFRDDHQFEALKKAILPEIFERKKTVKIWSAGCSTGEEVYSISIIARELAKNKWNGRIEILGTDINTEVIRKAELGVYQERSLRAMSKPEIKKYFDKLDDKYYRIKNYVREGVKYKVHNLLNNEPPGYDYDVIFCRNVMIYFDLDAQSRTVDGLFRKAIASDGYLIIGSCESLIGKTEFFKFSRIMNTSVYRLKTKEEIFKPT